MSFIYVQISEIFCKICGKNIYLYIVCVQFSVYANILLNTCNKTAHARPKLLLTSLKLYHINTTTSCPDRLWCPHSLLFCRYGESSTSSSRIKRVRREAVPMPSSSSDIKNEWSLTSIPSTFRYHGKKQFLSAWLRAS